MISYKLPEQSWVFIQGRWTLEGALDIIENEKSLLRKNKYPTRDVMWNATYRLYNFDTGSFLVLP